MKKIKPFYYLSDDKKESVHIDYNDLRHDHYTIDGKARWLLGSASDRIEHNLLYHNFKKITKIQFDKQLEKYDAERTTKCINVPVVDAGNL